MAYRLPTLRIQPRGSQAQLSLPLELPRSARAVPFQSHELSKGIRLRPSPTRLERDRAILARRGTVPVSSTQNNNPDYFRQRQRFLLTPPIFTIITEVNGNRWPGYVAALPPLQSRKEPEPSSGCPAFGRGGARLLQGDPLG